jgi:transposase
VPERHSFDYVRHGTIDLSAALNIATGTVISKLPAQHRAVDFRDFLDQIDRQTGPGLAVHVICDNLSTHKAPVVHRWLLAHPRFMLHFTPTYSSWINQAGRWLAELQRRCPERGVFCSLEELTSARRVDQVRERRRSALQMDHNRRPDHRPHLPLLLTHLRTGTLGRRARLPGRGGSRSRPSDGRVAHRRGSAR